MRPYVARRSTIIFALAVALLTLATAEATRAAVARPSACDQIASPSESPRTFVESLRRGEVGCLRDGVYRSRNRDIKFATPDVTLSSYPGERAAVVGRIWISARADGVTVRDLLLNGRNSGASPSPTVNADHALFRGNEVTNRHTAVCFVLGDERYGRAEGTLIDRNRIHDCGELPATNHDHGIYVAHASGTVISNNWIYENADRGVQLYPDADESVVTGNVIHANGEGVILGGGRSSASDGNLIAGNLITDSVVRGNVESSWQGPIGERNVVRGNCLFGGAGDDGDGGLDDPDGFMSVDNRLVEPRYLDPGRGDFRLRHGSPCRLMVGLDPR